MRHISDIMESPSGKVCEEFRHKRQYINHAKHELAGFCRLSDFQSICAVTVTEQLLWASLQKTSIKNCWNMLNNLTLILFLRRTIQGKTRFYRFLLSTCMYIVLPGRFMYIFGQWWTCSKNSAMCSLSVLGCGLSLTLFLTAKILSLLYWIFRSCSLLCWCEIARSQTCNAKSVREPHNNNRYGEII